MAHRSLPNISSPTDFRILARLFFIHLRLNFQILLAPIFLWGFYLAGGQPNPQFWLAFMAFHGFLYGGATVYNSYYDRDEGPVGGLEHPPPVVSALLPLSLIWQSVGLVLALWVNFTVGLIYGLIFALFTAYSHPRSRLKGRPIIGLLTVALGQGVLAAGGGWAVADPHFEALYALGVVAVLAAATFTTGFYPITQIYQVDEDLARGDLTFAAWAGPADTFVFGLVTMTLAVGVLAVVFFWLFGFGQMLLLSLFCLGWLAMIGRWAITYDAGQVLANYRYVMRLYRLMTLGFLGFLCLHLFNLWPLS
ncbi:MAG: UbiA family prenyltransferase [Anaerolineae bacterium]|nr:UbiA family prenyltransferase [Anaerolineae bacterium]